MPTVTDIELEKSVKKLLDSLDWNEPGTNTKQVAEDFYVIVRTMAESILENQLSGGGKGPGPLPHQPKDPTPNGDGFITRQEDYLSSFSSLMFNIANTR